VAGILRAADMNRKTLLLLGLFVLLGPTPLVIGGVLTWTAWVEHRKAVDAEQTREGEGWLSAWVAITSCTPITRDARTGDWTYRSEGEWKDRDGKTHRKTFRGGSCSTGTSHEIRYNPQNPEENVHVVGWFTPVPLILCVLGFGFSFIGVKEWLKARRRDPVQASSAPPRAP
jgi:hypothetical protein